MKYLDLPKRYNKPRENGLTSIHDVSLSLGDLNNYLDTFSNFIDISKLGIGTAFITPKLEEKIKLYKKFNIKVCFGGTLFEKFYKQNKIELYKKFLKEKNINLVEISTGTIDINLKERLKIVESFAKEFEVFAEIGSKDNNKIMPPSEWNYEIISLLNSGASKIIAEGRISGSAGIYRNNGELRDGLIHDMLNNVDHNKIIFEAPNPKSQMIFINKFGSNVNLGNIIPNQVLELETQRMGLRSETFNIS